MDINSLYNVSSGAIRDAMKNNAAGSAANDKNMDVFQSFLDSAMTNIKETNAYISDAEDEEVRLAMGETNSTHDLTIALQKASTAISYTVAVRDKFIEAYRQIMQMQI